MAEAKGKKLRRKPRDKGYYAAQFGITDDNKKKRLGKHIRHFPESLMHQTQKVAEPIFGALYEKIVQGHVANRTAKARMRAERRARKVLAKMKRTLNPSTIGFIGIFDGADNAEERADSLQIYLDRCDWQF